MSRYLDTSVVIPLFVTEPTSEITVRWIGDGAHEMFIADLVATEFHAVISRLIRKGVMPDEQAAAIRLQFDVWRDAAAEPLENLPVDIRAAGMLVRTPQPKLLSADATHLATCRRLGLVLVTYDADLQSVAEREGIPWECPA